MSNERALRVLSLLGWTLVVFFFWLSWLGAAVDPNISDKPISQADFGFIATVTGGCCGTTWVMGLAALVLIFVLVRR